MNISALGQQNVDRFGEYVQLHFEGREFTNVELLDAAARFGAALAEVGVRAGDRVGVMLPNLPEVGVAYGAILRLGAVAMPMVFLLAIPEIAHILDDSQASLVITSPEFHPNIAAACAQLTNPPRIVVTGDGDVPNGCLSYAQMLGGVSARAEIVDRGASDLAVVMYTSGTTGRPKGVMLSHGNLAFNAEAAGKAVSLRDGDVSLQALPLSHLFGLASSVTASLFKVTGVLLRWFTAEGWFEAVGTHRVGSGALVPAMVTYMLAHPEFDQVDWSSLRWVVVGAAPLPVEVAREFEERTGARVLEGYGLTETSPTVSVSRIEDPHRLGTAGRPVPGVEVAIFDDEDKPVPRGEPGEICVRGPNVMLGYYGMPEATAEVIRHGWFHTGDVGTLDEHEYLQITERKKDLIIRGGFNIFPRDVEEVVHMHPGVLECAVVGLPDPRLGEEVVAYVVLRPEAQASAQEIMALCREHLAKYKTPKHVVFTDVLPKNPIGKILKKDLRVRAQQDIAVV